MNDSSTGGPLAPVPGGPAPLQGARLLAALQNWVVQVTGMSGDLVRPRWQTEPPTIPTAGTAWAAVGIVRRPSDAFPAVVHDGAGAGGAGVDHVYRNEMLECLASFYDLGSGGAADDLASLLREGSAIGQNREFLTNAGLFLVDVGEALVVPLLKHERWLYRVDLPFRIRRTAARDYPVLNVKQVQVTIQTQDPTGRIVSASATVNLP